MPYHVVEDSAACPAYEPHAVVADGDGEVMGCHASVADARRQLAALHANEPEMSASALPGAGMMAPVETSIALQADLGVSPLAFSRFVAEASDWTQVRSAEVESTLTWAELLATAAEVGAEVVVNIEGDRSCDAVFRVSTAAGPAVVLAHLSVRWEEFHLDVAAGTQEAAVAAAGALGALVPPRPRGTPGGVDVAFWMEHPMAGAVYRRKSIDRLAWSDSSVNYPPSMRASLDGLVALRSAPSGGRMMVFHGPPGTGKTRFVQSLASEWSEWCDFDYIVDPDEMFKHALYLNAVLLDGDNDPGRWRLIVIEDGDEFIDANAKARVGAGAARLLNVADGLIGQGLRVMVLVTTNVASTAFSEAIVRTGRCGALVEFPGFAPDEAAAWCAERGVPAPEVDGPVTLADLYGLTR